MAPTLTPGVLAPLKTAKRSVAKAILKPFGIAFAVLLLLVAIKLLIFAMVRAVRDSDVPTVFEVQRDRQHDELDPDPVGVSNARDRV